MYEYEVTPSCRTEEVKHVAAQMQKDGWSLEHTHVRSDTVSGIRYDLLWRKASKDISYGQMLINRYHDKLVEVADTLEAVNTHPAIVKDIRDFLFQGSPDDM